MSEASAIDQSTADPYSIPIDEINVSDHMGIGRSDRRVLGTIGQVVIAKRQIAGAAKTTCALGQQGRRVGRVRSEATNPFGVADVIGPVDVEGPGGATQP